MASQKLAAIASAGVVLLAAPIAGAVALGAARRLRAPAARLPRPGRLGATGSLLLVLLAAGVLGGLFALSRADWRVLDLGPLVALAIAAVLGAGHGIFWFRHGGGRRWRAVPGARRRRGAALVAWRRADGGRAPPRIVAGLWKAVGDGSLGLRFGTALARAFTDHDGDGFSARFGGGDCDDTPRRRLPRRRGRPRRRRRPELRGRRRQSGGGGP